jgi:SAM-dependent methyltransferase
LVHYIDGVPLHGTEAASSSWHARLVRSNVRYMSRRIHEGFDESVLRKRTGPEDAPIHHHKTALQQQGSNVRNSTRPTDHMALGHVLGDIKLNIGCGGDIRPGFINIDILEAPGVDLVWDIRPRMQWEEHIYPYPGSLPWPDSSVDEILASHCIEHFIYHHAPDLIRDWIRMLRPGGRIEIITPDFDQVIDGITKGTMQWLTAIQNLYAGEIEWPPSGCWYHYSCYNWAWLYGQLVTWGCDPYSIVRLPIRPGVQGIVELRMEAKKA